MLTRRVNNRLLAIIFVCAMMTFQPEFAAAQAEDTRKGFYMKLEGRYLWSDGDAIPYSVRYNGFIPKSNPIGLNEIRLDSDTTLRAGIGYRFGNLDFGLLYSGLKTNGNHHAKRCHLTTSPTVNPTQWNLNRFCPSQNHTSTPLIGYNLIPGGPALASTGGLYYGGLKATYDTTYHVVDFEAGYTMNLGRTEVRAMAGVRYAQFDQRFEGIGFLLFNYNPIVLSRRVENWGVGPLLGVEANHPLWGGVSLSGSVKGSYLFGDRDTVDATQVIFNQWIKGDQGDTNDTFWSAEGDLGLSFMAELGNASSVVMTLGYRVEAWFDVNNTKNSFVPAFFPNAGDVDADQFFHGPFMRATVHF